MSKVTPQDLEAFVQLFEASDWDHVDIEMDDFSLHLSKKAQSSGLQSSAQISRVTPLPAASVAPAPSKMRPAAAPVSAPPSQRVVPPGCVAIKAPHLGTFYQSPKPGMPPYVTAGTTVAADSEVGMMEVMKLFTTLRAGSAGVVKEVWVKDAQLVESGDVLFVIEPGS